MIFIHPDGGYQEVDAPVGKSVLDIAHNNGIYELEGACEGSMSCSTCHVIVDPNWFGKLPAASEEEDDILDLAYGLTKTSRLGCQILMATQLDGLTVKLPFEHINVLDSWRENRSMN